MSKLNCNVLCMVKVIYIVVLCLVTGCSVEFKSKQFNYIKSMVRGSLDKSAASFEYHWYLFDGDELRDAFALVSEGNYKIIALGGMEVDFVETYISKIVMPGFGGTYTITPTSYGAVVKNTNSDRAVSVKCDYLAPVSEVVYVQSCRSLDGSWSYKNELEVDVESREIVFIKTYYWPSEPPLELYLGDLYESLKASGGA